MIVIVGLVAVAAVGGVLYLALGPDRTPVTVPSVVSAGGSAVHQPVPSTPAESMVSPAQAAVPTGSAVSATPVDLETLVQNLTPKQEAELMKASAARLKERNRYMLPTDGELAKLNLSDAQQQQQQQRVTITRPPKTGTVRVRIDHTSRWNGKPMKRPIYTNSVSFDMTKVKDGVFHLGERSRPS
jgi:hypothetical protein